MKKQKLYFLKNNPWPNLTHHLQYGTVVTIALFIVIFTSSCGNVKNLQYLQGSFDTARLSKVEVVEPVIQKGDMLGITVYSDDAQATAAVTNPLTNTSGLALGNAVSANSASAGGTSTLQGFLVSQIGEIQLYKLGTIPVEGKTKKQLADTLALLYSNNGLLKNPYVEIRFLSFKVTVIGEVNKPGSFSAPTDKINAFEAIGLAGDITTYGRRDNVLIIREVNGVRHFARLDLRDPNVLLSPFYYLHQNDMVVVDVGKSKAAVNNQGTMQALSIGTSLLSIVAVFISIFRR